MSQLDIRVGTLVAMSESVKNIPQILPHGFESFSLTFWEKINCDIESAAKKVLEVCGDKAVISTIGFFGNPLQNPEHAVGFSECIDKAHLFGAKMVSGFAGALEDRPVNESMEQYKKVWEPLAKKAKDKGIRIAFENCDMNGRWEAPKYNIAHSPTAWEMMFNAFESENVGLEWEPCHQMNSLIDPLPQLRKLLETGKIFHVHGKDATIAWDVLKTYGLRGGKQFVWHRTPGFGDTNWTDVISMLRMAKWSGCIDIEGWHDPVYCGEKEMTGQVFALNYLKNCRGGPFVANPK